MQVMDAPSEKLSIRGGYNLPSLNFSALELYEKIKQKLPNFNCQFAPDHRQEYADSWPDQTDGSIAESEWGFQLDYDLDSLCSIMIDSLQK